MASSSEAKMVASNQPPARDNDEAVLHFVEQFGLILNQSGMPRMPARVFAYVLADDREIYTAGELAEGLRVSPAAISGAVRYLLTAGMLAKERRPGARQDHYRVYDSDVWSTIALERNSQLVRYEEVLEDGLKLLGENRSGGRRVRETLEYFRFMRAELPMMIERWRERRDELGVGVLPHSDPYSPEG